MPEIVEVTFSAYAQKGDRRHAWTITTDCDDPDDLIEIVKAWRKENPGYTHEDIRIERRAVYAEEFRLSSFESEYSLVSALVRY